ncbi:MAG TPA: beta-1,6-N-acetylglucosaminyltransferase [Sediminibacterium sp.]|nr:beta-1,6-N-acetylglucosaminyltransferase [Sediminibacterium sp.]
MRIAHLIITYTNPQQTERMIRRMQDPKFDFYIHVDAKLPVSSHAYLEEIPNVYLIKNRIKVQWAAYSTIQAEFNSIKEILESGRSYDFVSLMSGQDYPIKSIPEIKQFYAARRGKLLLKYRKFEGEWEEGMLRVSRYFLTDFKFKGQHFLERVLNNLLPNKQLPGGMKFYGSSMFWSLSPDVLVYVLQQFTQNKKLVWFFKFCWAPDEFLFQTMILNSPFADRVINENAFYYKHLPNTPSPKVLALEDWEDIKASDRILARKFDMIKSPEILDRIDAHIAAYNS